MGKSSYKSAASAELIATKTSELLKHWPVERQELDLQTRHGRTRVIVCGNSDNPPLLLFHPAGCSSVYWLRHVQTYMKSHRVYAVDIIGEAGASEDRRPPFKGQAYVEWVEDIYLQLGISQAALVGMSLGAWICLKFATARPEQVERLGLISPQGIVRSHRRPSIVGSFFNSLLGPLGRRITYAAQLRRSDMEPRLQQLMLLSKSHLRARPAQLPRFTDQELSQLYCPVLLLVGGKDAFFNSDALLLRACKCIPQLEVHYRPRDGHFLSEFAREVDRLLVTNYAPD